MTSAVNASAGNKDSSASSEVDRQRGVGFEAFQHEVDGRAGGLQGGIVEGAFREHGSVTSREKQDVAFPQRHLETLREGQNHLAARHGAAALHKAEVFLRDLGIES